MTILDIWSMFLRACIFGKRPSCRFWSKITLDLFDDDGLIDVDVWDPPLVHGSGKGYRIARGTCDRERSTYGQP